MTYVLIPGAWTGAWVWDEVASLLASKGCSVHALTLPGLESIEDAAGVTLADAAGVTLDRHVQEVINFLESRQFKRVVLVGHSYSGLVVGQVAAQAPELVHHTVYIEAFLPIDGKSLIEVSGLDYDEEKRLIKEHSGLWPPPTRDELEGQPYLNRDHIELLASKMVGHPGRTVTDPATVPTPLSAIRSTFIASEGWLSGSRESSLLASLKDAPAWTFKVIEGGHWPMLTIPDQLADLLDPAHF